MPNINLTGVEATANKSTDVNIDQASNTKYPSVKAMFDWAVNLFHKKSDTTIDLQSDNKTDYSAGWVYADDASVETGFGTNSEKIDANRSLTTINNSFVILSESVSDKHYRVRTKDGAKYTELKLSPDVNSLFENTESKALDYVNDPTANVNDLSFAHVGYVKSYANIRSIAKQTTDGTTLTGTTAETKQTAFLIPANTFTTGSAVELKFLARKAGGLGSGAINMYLNTSDTLVGATQVSRLITSANGQLFIKGRRDFIVKSSTITEYLSGTTSSVNDYNTFTVAASQTNINWAVDQYIIPSLQLGNAGDSLTLSYVNIIKS